MNIKFSRFLELVNASGVKMLTSVQFWLVVIAFCAFRDVESAEVKSENFGSKANLNILKNDLSFSEGFNYSLKNILVSEFYEK